MSRGSVSRRKRQRFELVLGSAILGSIVLASLLIPALGKHGSNDLVGAPYQPPSAEFLFGTDSAGRDLFVRVWAAGRLDLLLAVIIVGASLVIGTLIGTFSGSSKSRLDGMTMRVVDAVIAFPFIVLVLAFIAVVGGERSFWGLPPGAPAVMIAILLVDWAIYARLARGQTLSLRERDHVVAAVVLGYSRGRIIRRHLMPGVFRVTAAYAVADIIIIIIAIASLSFLGAGIQAPTAEWGAIMYEGRTVLSTSWWISVIPGIVLAITGIGISLIADALLHGSD